MKSRRIGLARVLSKLGYCSRARAFELIRADEVRVNGKVERNPERPTDPARDRVEVAHIAIRAARFLYYVVNKPRGLITTASDEKGRETIYSLLPPDSPWVAPVGRLDKASEGLLLLTNDSEWAAKITDPNSHLDKTYHVQVSTLPSEQMVEALSRGIRSDGELLLAKRVSILRAGGKNGWLEIVLEEGKNRQIRRMVAALQIEVLRLIRVAIGPLTLGELPKGGCRALTAEEKAELDDALRLVRGEH
ncbi:pseudouridine synthase [Candidatus Korobacter versatilis]|uniref:pseudouridine synthase n=1 Tax=Candidatus Korobacter versatilis TaxID=658062 RepID=UPI001E55F666|nr:pseudouridine synthase [Candidatus Koribacter versatilis]